ncbi:MAG: MliC family protein [Alphaproteobacteria bacterium]|nr:MliC family protein [Alphaproteobacteria bacterium]
MKTSLFLIPLLALAACSKPDAPISPTSEPKTVSIPWVHYVCSDGRTVSALYTDSQTAQLKLGGSTHLLKVAQSGSGARYTGDALQWWTKGDEGMLAPLKPSEDIAADPGVTCVPPARAPVEPPAPGTPGGLPDDRTPLDERPFTPESAQGASNVLQTYYALVESGRTAEAAKLRVDGREEDLKPFASLHAQTGGPGQIEGAAGSLFVEVPVVLYGRYATGGEYHASGKATLRRVNNVPGATAEQLKWRIEKIEVK